MNTAPTTSPAEATSLDALLRRGSIDLADVATRLEGLSSEARIAEVRGLSRGAQAQLHDAAKGFRKLRLTDLVPAGVEDREEVVHYGKNSLAMFTEFAKVFCRPKRDARELWGYNRAGRFVERVVGPGYYVAYEGPSDEVLVDYTRTPEGRIERWPEVLSNSARLSRFVYADMIDALRSITTHVSVGRAIRHGKVQDNWFVLCRA
jgi:hypothetical protein